MAGVKLVLVYMTARDARQARRIGDALVQERLAACVNVLGPISSIYRWKGAVQRGREVAFIAKTRASLLPRLQIRVGELHDYEVPCVVAVPLAGGNRAFLDWVAAETAVSRSGVRPTGRSVSGSKAAAAPR